MSTAPCRQACPCWTWLSRDGVKVDYCPIPSLPGPAAGFPVPFARSENDSYWVRRFVAQSCPESISQAHGRKSGDARSCICGAGRARFLNSIIVGWGRLDQSESDPAPISTTSDPNPTSRWPSWFRDANARLSPADWALPSRASLGRKGGHSRWHASPGLRSSSRQALIAKAHKIDIFKVISAIQPRYPAAHIMA